MSADPRYLAAVSALLVAVAGCAPGESPAGGTDHEPTFERLTDDSFRYTEPLATPADLLPPAGDGGIWHIVGSVLDPANRRAQAAVWQSEDGTSWQREDLAPTETGVAEEMLAVTRTEDGLLATGSAGVGEAADAVLWRSSGEADAGWTQVAPPEMAGDHELWGFDIAAGDGGVLVAGGERAWGDVRPRLWHSVDGEQWQVVDGGDDGPFQGSGQESISAVTAFGDGFVAVGWERVEGEQNGLAWYSPDGRSWEAVDAPELGGDRRQALLSVAATEDGVVAGGYAADETGQGQPVVWRSEDGQSWSEPSGTLPLEDSRRSTGHDLSVRSLQVATPASSDGEDGGDESPATTLMAAGGTQARPQVWRSNDGGASWDALPAPRTATFPDGIDFVAAGRAGSTTVAVGSEPLVVNLEDDDWQIAGGEAFPDGGSKPAGMTVVLDGDITLIGGYQLANWHASRPQQHYEARVWRREGNGGFEAVEPVEEGEDLIQDFSAGAIEDMAAYGEGYVAVGRENFSIARERSAGNPSPDGIIWRSEDGQDWRRVAYFTETLNAVDYAEHFAPLLDEDYSVEDIVDAVGLATLAEPRSTQAPAGGDGTRSLRGVAPMGDTGFIAVGSTYDDGDVSPIVAKSTTDGVDGEDADLSGAGNQRFNDVCRAPGVIVAVGTTGSDGRYDTAIRYRDGDGWHEAGATDDSFTSPGSQQAVACASSDEGFVVVGSDDSGGNRNAKVWTSEDGIEWQEVTAGILGGSGDQEATAVAAVPDGGWLIAGRETAGQDAGIALWRLHSDGEVERRDLGEPALSGPSPMTAEDVAVSSDRVVVVGADVDGLGIWETPTDELDR